MQFFDIRGTRYAFDQYGESGPLILFGHGLYFDRTMFAGIARSLAINHRCVCIDWPGHGNSGWRANGWTVQDLVDDVPELISALNARDAVLVGLSQGAAVFTRTALQHPDSVRALVVMDASPLAQDAAVVARSVAAAQVILGGSDSEVSALLDQTLQRMFCAHTRAHAPELVAQARDRMLAHPRGGLALALGLGRSYERIAEQLDKLRMPALILWGEADAATPPALIDHYRRIPDVTVQTFARAGHSLALEQPDAVTEALHRFLAAHHIQ
jgi:3-oxoadipate enol-lactonase